MSQFSWKRMTYLERRKALKRQKAASKSVLSLRDGVTDSTRAVVSGMTNHLVASVVTGLVFAWVSIAWLVYRVEAMDPHHNIKSYGDALWWGIVTVLTIGYGDRYPVTPEGRMFAGLLMVLGVFTTSIVTARISSIFLESALNKGRGHVSTHRLKDHFIVCGWKDDMHQLLTHILDFNPGMSSNSLVLIANVTQTVFDSIREQPGLENLHIIVGDYFRDTNLKRAAPERARKILILADRSPGPNGQVPSMTEVDARTIMTAMNLSAIARNTLVAAEILDPKMDHYLKLANVSEIIYTREYSRLLLGNASGGTGVANIILDLLDPKTPTVVTTRSFDEDWVDLSYVEFRQKFEAKYPWCQVVGILENTGNSHSIKELALRQAQKTPDMRRLVQNLKSVRELRCNHPVFNPTGEYRIPEGSMAIVIETRGKSGKGEQSDDRAAEEGSSDGIQSVA